MIYLAAPYTHDDPSVVELRVRQVNRFAADLIRQGRFVFSPISHSHAIATTNQLPTNYAFWRTYNIEWLRRCNELYVLCLEGWKDSRGVNDERHMAGLLNIPIRYYDFVDTIDNVGHDTAINKNQKQT